MVEARIWVVSGAPVHFAFSKGDRVVEEKTISVFNFNRFLDQNKLMGSRCKKCGTLFLPPRSICIKCYKTEMDWVQMKGKGKLVTFTSINVGPTWMVEEGYDRKHPYCSGVVDLEEGVRIDARIEGVDGSKPETIKVGMPLTVEFLHRGEGDDMHTFLAFKPV